MEPVTQSDTSSVYALSYFPDDERILLMMDGNGDEIYKLFVKEGENLTRLTPAENARALFYGWAKDGESFYYSPISLESCKSKSFLRPPYTTDIPRGADC